MGRRHIFHKCLGAFGVCNLPSWYIQCRPWRVGMSEVSGGDILNQYRSSGKYHMPEVSGGDVRKRGRVGMPDMSGGNV